MSNFNDIKQQWATRQIPQPPTNQFMEIVEKSNQIRKKQWIGQMVLAVTSILLIAFFFYISAHKNPMVFMGLGVMIGSLLLRIGIEFFAMIKKNYFPADKDMKAFNGALLRFYKRRRFIHFVVTPLLFISYIFGFMMLLPSFKLTFSTGFYTYILISSCFVFIGLAILIGVQIHKELELLRSLRRPE